MHRFTKLIVSPTIIVMLLSISLSTALFVTSRAAPAHADTAQTYIVLYKAQAVPADAANVISQAGGTLVYSYPQIGVAIARSDSTTFGTNLMDDNGHGTHTAGTIAAASNGIGIVGVAPNVHIAAIKAGDAAGFFFPEAVVCAFVWAGTHHMDVTNNSYFADPFLYNCRNDPVQRAIWKAEQRAILIAEQQGVTVVAAAGNESEDISHPTQDVTSPDNTTPVAREVK